jgi:hypothetical protein
VTNVTHSTLVNNVSLIQAAVLIASTNVLALYQAAKNKLLFNRFEKGAHLSAFFYDTFETFVSYAHRLA